jgi:signal transduction histidine kinase/DNA-binding response OmpR family regulator/HPt (histidine-containing phosphotransfer) domain-containing protein
MKRIFSQNFFPVFQPMSLKGKFFFILVLTSALSLLFACSVLVFNDLWQIRESLVDGLAEQAGLIGENSSAALVFHDEDAAQEILSAFRHQSNILQAVLFTTKGNILSQYQPGAPPDFVKSFEKVIYKLSWQSIEIYRKIYLNNEHVGTIYLLSNLHPVYQRFHDLLLITIVAMFLSCLLALVITARLQKSILDPLVHLTSLSTRISQSQDYSLRAPTKAPDEIGTLIDGFNSMLQEIQDREQELEQHRTQLAQRIAERTTELSDTNARLQNEIADRERIRQEISDMAVNLQKKNHELAVSRDAALQAARAKADFLATMSHEIRTPMNGVIGMTGLLLETSLTTKQRSMANTVSTSAEALLDILNDILDFSKMEAGKLELESIEFNLSSTLEDTLDLMAERASQKQVELTGLVFPDVPTRLKGDPGRIRQILLNLIGNAIKFTNQGEVSVQVLFMGASESQVEIRFHVWDTGIGIAPEAKGKLFDSFTQAASSTTRKYGGTGLGLTICKQLVERMDGTIGVESRQGEWSLFWFSVKLDIASPTTQTEWLPQLDLRGQRVLCVDDNPTTLFLLESYAKSWGMDPTTTSSARQCIPILQEAVASGHPFDLAILDRSMPDLDGIQLGQLIRDEADLAHTKLLLLTSIRQRGEAAAAHQAGFAGYLTKPLRKVQLHNGLATVMGYCWNEESEQIRPLVTRHTLKETRRLSREKILVADDHAINQQLIVLLLERLGYGSDVVTTGREAVKAVATGSYALVLMDCQMPEMDGFEATRMIREAESENSKELGGKNNEQETNLSDTSDSLLDTPHCSRIPIVALTANAMPGDRENCLTAGMDEYISKPIRLEELALALERLLPVHPDDNHTLEHLIALESDFTQSDVRANHMNNDDSPLSANEASNSEDENPSPINHALFQEWQEHRGPEFVAKMAEQFVSDVMTCVRAIEQALDQRDSHGLGEAVHGLKGICANMGATQLHHMAIKIEQANREGKTLDGPQTMKMLQTAVAHITNFLATFQSPRL